MWRAVILLYLCMTLATAVEDLCSEQHQWQAGGRVWLETVRVPTTGRARSLVGTFCSAGPLVVQLWTKKTAYVYHLVWQKKIARTPVGQRKVIPLNEEEYFYVNKDDRLALYVSSSEVIFPVPVSFSNEYGGQLVYSLQQGPFDLWQNYEFMDLGRPRSFQIDFCDSQDCPEATETTTQKSVSTPKPLNEKKVSCAPRLNSTGRVLLEQERNYQSGPVRAIAGFFCAGSRVRVQVWELLQATSHLYRLIWEKEIKSPATDGSWHVIPLEQSEVFYYRDTYRIALFAPQDGETIPIPYSFAQTGNSLVQSQESGGFYQCHASKFEDLGYPMEFQMQFCHNKDCTTESLGPGFTVNDVDICPPIQGTALPPAERSTTAPQPAVAPTDPGSVTERNSLNPISSSGHVLLDSSFSSHPGHVKALAARFSAESPVHVQVWEPIRRNVYRLVWSKEIEASYGGDVWRVVSLEADQLFYLKSSYKMALHVPEAGSLIPIAYKIMTGGKVVHSVKDNQVKFCDVTEFDDLDYPYKFSIKFCPDKDCTESLNQPDEIAENRQVCPNPVTTQRPAVKTEKSKPDATTAAPSLINVQNQVGDNGGASIAFMTPYLLWILIFIRIVLHIM